MKTPSATGLLRFALAILVVVAVLSLAASLQLPSEGVGLPELRGLPVLGIDPILLIWVFGIGSVVLFLLAFLLYRPRSSRGSLHGILALVLAVSLLIFFSYLVRPSFPASDAEIPGPGTLDPPGGGTGTGGGGTAGGDGPGTGDPGSGGGDGNPGGTGSGTGTGGTTGTGGDGTGGPGSGTGGGDPGGTGPGTTPGDGEVGSGGNDGGTGAGTGTGSLGGDSELPGGGPPGQEQPPGLEDPGTGQEGGTTGSENPGSVVDPVFPWSAFFTGAFLLFVAFLMLVAVHVLRGTLRARWATAADRKAFVQSPETLRAELLEAFESLSAAGAETEADVRATILASYDQMLRLFQSSGLNPGQHLTAREVEALAMERLQLSPGAARVVRLLFEEARYSLHRLGDLQRREVIESLRRVRSELAG